MELPTLYGDYDRKAVHDLFDSSSTFTTGSGLWGIRGIIPLPSAGDFALFVTFGKQEGEHLFDESISSEGILRWQSEPKQTLNSRRVRELIAHDERQNVVHLFLRTSHLRGGVAPPFTYLGPLKYRSHDRQREQPVHVAWDLLEWPIPPEIATRMRLEIVTESEFVSPAAAEAGPSEALPTNSLLEDTPPKGLARTGESTRAFTARKRRYISSEQSRDLGLKGELLVLQRECLKLIHAGRSDLADQVRHTSVADGDGAGYDIRSFFEDGRTKFIEVKTTTGPKTADFLISPNELAFSAQHASSFELCRVFNYDSIRNSASSYSVFGDVSANFDLTETQYRARYALS